jgi:hypothetical protein
MSEKNNSLDLVNSTWTINCNPIPIVTRFKILKQNKDNIKLGLKENWKQFTILICFCWCNGWNGKIISKFAEVEFGMASKTAILSFIVAFRVTKAITNYFTGKLANRFGRKNLLLFGWF